MVLVGVVVVSGWNGWSWEKFVSACVASCMMLEFFFFKEIFDYIVMVYKSGRRFEMFYTP